MTIRVRVLSDLHLENHVAEAIPGAAADLVVLAGDIHNHAEGLRWAAATFDPAVPVIYVPGNHEYYDGTFGALEAAMRDTARTFDHVHYLNGDVYVSPNGGLRVLGTTLWTDFTLFGADDTARDAAMDACARTMFDFNGAIQVDGAEVDGAAHANAASRALTPADTLRMHRAALAWLDAELARPWDGETIVVTHHAPHPASLAERYAREIVSAGFISDLSARVAPPVSLWVHGHTHTSFDYTTTAGTRVVCNPRGHLRRRTGERENPAFAWDKVVTLGA